MKEARQNGQALSQAWINYTIEQTAAAAAQAAVNAFAGSSSQSQAAASEVSPSRESTGLSAVQESPNSLTVNVASETFISINSYTSQQALDSVNELPVMLVKDVFSGEFMNLSKLWLRNFNSLEPLHDEPLTLAVKNVDNSVIRVNKAKATSITNIQGWTSAFTAYKSVIISKHQNRAAELLEYLCLNHYAAKYHRAKGWCVYDVKFRQKAVASNSITWSVIDS